MTNHAPNSTKNGSLIMMAILALQLSSAASEPEIAAAGWAPRLHETLQRAAAVGSDEPFVVPTTGGGPPPNLTLRTILEPFASKLSSPFVKLTNGAGGESTARTDLPGTLDEVVEMMTASSATRPSSPSARRIAGAASGSRSPPSSSRASAASRSRTGPSARTRKSSRANGRTTASSGTFACLSRSSTS